MIIDPCFEIPKLGDSISKLSNTVEYIRNMELEISQHIRRTYLWSVSIEVEDTAQI